MTTTSTDTFSEQVARGAAVLDAHRPGWRGRIDPDRLDMNKGLRASTDEGGCVLAQLNADGDYYAEAGRLQGDAEPGPFRPWARDHGFSLDWGASSHTWARLTAAWREVLARDQH